MNNKVKKFLPLIITSSVLVLAVTANIVTACIDVNNLPAISYEDVPSDDKAYAEYQTAKQNYDSINMQVSEIDTRISEKQKEVDKYENMVDELSTSIDDLKNMQSEISSFTEKYDRCLAEAQRLDAVWSVYRDMDISHIEANYDANNLRANQNNSNIYSVIGDYTGVFGQALSNQMDTNIYKGFDKIIASVNTITNTVNEHLYKADLLLSKIKTKIESADNLVTEELSGEKLLFEMELFESAYFGKDDLFETERKELVYELSYSKAVLDAVYPIYEIMLSDCSENTSFLNTLKNRSIQLENYLYSIYKSDSELLTDDEIAEITKNAYQLIPMICDVAIDPSYLYKGIRTVGPDYISTGGFMSSPDTLYYGVKNNNYIFMIRQYANKSDTPHKAFYYAPNGSLIYAEYKGNVVCLLNGEVVYSSDVSRTDTIIQTAENDYNKYYN